MPGQKEVGDGVQADDVKADALIAALYDIGKYFLVQAGIIPKITVSSPETVPAQIKEQEIRLLHLLSIGL